MRKAGVRVWKVAGDAQQTSYATLFHSAGNLPLVRGAANPPPQPIIIIYTILLSSFPHRFPFHRDHPHIVARLGRKTAIARVWLTSPHRSDKCPRRFLLRPTFQSAHPRSSLRFTAIKTTRHSTSGSASRRSIYHISGSPSSPHRLFIALEVRSGSPFPLSPPNTLLFLPHR
ncbi:hypothetical protein CALCODRAFT_84018 [Calocera cornea HHB12733]|uniref:Uncharacterized protein n=1 Tax=Calocera cornea HHB12733 TaxID=1353952 RepID=A0A165ILU9_9BASI|nr:hypothetical protein CALCODRAFT_84018 [Calocera cornea HHB12733]